MKTSAALLLVGFAVAAMSAALQTEQAQSVAWRYSKQDDPLHGVSIDQFVLEGKYLTPPSRADRDFPSLVVRCSSGKFKEAYLAVGAVVQFGENTSGGVVHSLSGVTQARVERRMDNKKHGDVWWEISNDGKALFFDDEQLVDLMTGHLLGHPGDRKNLVRRLLLGVVEAFANQVVMQFDMPDDATEMVRACGLEWSKGKKK